MTPSLEELACLYVLDRLDASERAAFETRLLHDPELAALAHDLERTLARRIQLLPQQEPPAEVLARIEARLDAPAAAAFPPPPARFTQAGSNWVPWGLAAVFAIGLGVTSMLLLNRPRAADANPVVLVFGLDPNRSTLAKVRLHERSDGADARFAQLAALADKFWDDPSGLPNASSGASPEARGYALFDPESRQGFIAVRQLPSPSDQRRYHLWLLDTATGRATEAGVIPATASNGGLYSFSLSPDTRSEARQFDFFITTEDASVAPPTQPSDRVILGEKRI